MWLWQPWQTRRFSVRGDDQKAGARRVQRRLSEWSQTSYSSVSDFLTSARRRLFWRAVLKRVISPLLSERFPLAVPSCPRTSSCCPAVSTRRPSPSPGHSVHHTLISSPPGTLPLGTMCFGLGTNCPVSLTGEPLLLCELLPFPPKEPFGKPLEEKLNTVYLFVNVPQFSRAFFRFCFTLHREETEYLIEWTSIFIFITRCVRYRVKLIIDYLGQPTLIGSLFCISLDTRLCIL